MSRKSNMNFSSCCPGPGWAHGRREFLSKSAFGFGMSVLGSLMHGESGVLAGEEERTGFDPLVAKPQHFSAKAERVIFIFLQGGASHIDTFDPKPVLKRLDGQPLPDSFKSEDLDFQFIRASEAKLMGSFFPFRKYGESGLEISDLFRGLAQHADNLAVIRSCYHDSFVHGPALSLLHTGSIRVGHPSVGSWVLYGLGAEAENLPAYVVMIDASLRATTSLFSSGFLPAVHQGTLVKAEGVPMENLRPPAHLNSANRRRLLDQIQKWNEQHLELRQDNSRLAARMASYELAFRMQMAAPETFDLSREPDSIRTMYGLDNETTSKFGRMCLLSRRLAERGVRFIQLYSTDWDGHAQCDKNHLENAGEIDRPIAGLLSDLKQRGLLESTLVVCAGEFGRTPVMQATNGRDHNPYGFSLWLAGGGVRGGQVIGATDELGFRAVEDKVHVRDLHATILSLLGLDYKELTYFFHGLEEKLTGFLPVENNLYERLTSG